MPYDSNYKIPDWLPPVVVAGGAAAGAFPTVGNSSGNSTSNLNTQSTTGQSQWQNQDIQSILNTISRLTGATQTSATPTLSPESTAFMNQLIRQYSGLAGSNVNLAPYAAQQTQQINRNSNLQSQAVQNAMAARGLSNSPVSGTAEANIQANRIGGISNLLSQIPILRNQLVQGNLGSAAGFFSTLPRGVSQYGESSQGSETQQYGRNQGFSEGQLSSTTNTAQQGGTTTQSRSSQGGGIGSAISGGVSTLLALLPLLIP